MKNSNSKLRVGIAGYGVVGKRRREYIDSHENLITIAVSDINFKADGKFPDGLIFFNNYEKLFNLELDILFVCLPNFLAPEVTISGLKNCLNVFCEKPPGRTVEDIEKVIEVENEFPKLILKYGFNHRYHDSVIEAKRVIESGEYGKILNFRGLYGKSSIVPFESGWRSEKKLAGGGILLDQGIHMLDMIQYFSGYDFEEIHSFIDNRYWQHDVEDNAFVLMRKSDGTVAMLHSTATQWQHRFRLEIALEEALLELSGILSGSKSYGQEQLKIVSRKAGSSTGSFDENIKSYLVDHSWQDEINEFVEAILYHKPIQNGTSKDALEVMKLVHRIYAADQKWFQ